MVVADFALSQPIVEVKLYDKYKFALVNGARKQIRFPSNDAYEHRSKTGGGQIWVVFTQLSRRRLFWDGYARSFGFLKFVTSCLI